MIHYHVYPGGKRRIVTFSYDDGPVEDIRLIEMFNKYGVKGTFHLNGIRFANCTEAEKEALRRRYAGHEVSCHTLQHGWLPKMPLQSVVNETAADRKVLEEIFGYPIIGMSYPCGCYSDAVIAALKSCGIVYSRTVNDTHTFYLPNDFMEWHPSCHHNDAMRCSKDFWNRFDSMWGEPLFYIWGHSFEFDTEEKWQAMEEFVASIAGNEKIWYATNIEIYRYYEAQKRLEISMDETVFYNPSAIDVWVEKDNTQVIHIPAGQTVRI